MADLAGPEDSRGMKHAIGGTAEVGCEPRWKRLTKGAAGYDSDIRFRHRLDRHGRIFHLEPRHEPVRKRWGRADPDNRETHREARPREAGETV
jgi:hypothetical protein